MSSSPKNPKMNADRNGSACSIFRIRQEALGLKHMKEDPKQMASEKVFNSEGLFHLQFLKPSMGEQG